MNTLNVAIFGVTGQVGQELRDPNVFDNGIRFFVSGDQLLRGAALNGWRIFEYLYKKKLIPFSA